MSDRSFTVLVLALVCLGIYLFVSAPPPLDEPRAASPEIPVQELLAALQGANEAVRALWTQEIVADGTRAGLKFDEQWREADIEAGPLPALFLRETARSLERQPVRLSLFLGSDYPINQANAFEGMQLERFAELKRTGQPQFFYMSDTQRHTGMFSDVAVAEACVQCHNEHEDTPKSDWELNDVMGAVTWLYPAEAVTFEEFISAVGALHQGFRDAYTAYIDKVMSFADPPAVGEHWPRDGYLLPSPEVFMEEALRRTAPRVLPVLAARMQERRPDGEQTGDAVIR